MHIVVQEIVGDAKVVTSSSVLSAGGPDSRVNDAIIADLFQSPPPDGIVISVTKSFEFSAAHRLPYHSGRCQFMHGHNYFVEVTMEGPLQQTGSSTGMVEDFSFIKEDIERHFDWMDHLNVLNAGLSHPTAEVIAAYMVRTLHAQDPRYVQVKVWETNDSSATATITSQP